MNFKLAGTLKTIIGLFSTEKKEVIVEPKAYYNDYYPGRYVRFDGEKTPYELGKPIEYLNDYYSLSLRSWAAYLDTDVVQNAIKKYCLWIVGAGLKMQSTPVETILADAGIDISNISNFQKKAESYFRLYANTTHCTINKKQNLHEYAAEALKTALMSGDALCINRYDGKRATMQVIDGFYVRNPLEEKFYNEARERGNVIVNGIEKNKNGEHIAYYVLNEDQSYVRIQAKSEDGKTTYAWLLYGLKYKASDDRGLALLSAILETVAKMDRYKSAAVGSAEENSKIPYTIEANQFSDDEPIFSKTIKNAQAAGMGIAPETNISSDPELAEKIATSTEKQVFEMPIGKKLVRDHGKTDSNFSDFYGVNLDIVYSTLGIPPEVAADKFGGAYSGSRAALKSWEYKIMVDRTLMMTNKFYKPFYVFWLDIMVLESKILAPGYTEALFVDDFMIYEAYRSCRFIGITVPHIDPVKEVKAIRSKLGNKFSAVPLTTVSQAAEELNSGDYETIIQKTEKELELAESFIDTSPGDQNNQNSELNNNE